MKRKMARNFDKKVGKKLSGFAMPMLRVSLGIVYLWFGLLKVFNVSPLAPTIEASYFFLPFPSTLVVLGVWEALIGLGLIFKKFVRTTIVSLWCQIIGVFGSAILAPFIYFKANPLVLTLEGEFLIKNLILLAASLVILNYKAKAPSKI